jgi:hypothetical protein
MDRGVSFDSDGERLLLWAGAFRGGTAGSYNEDRISVMRSYHSPGAMLRPELGTGNGYPETACGRPFTPDSRLQGLRRRVPAGDNEEERRARPPSDLRLVSGLSPADSPVALPLNTPEGSEI